jgi:hypothetical protein
VSTSCPARPAAATGAGIFGAEVTVWAVVGAREGRFGEQQIDVLLAAPAPTPPASATPASPAPGDSATPTPWA